MKRVVSLLLLLCLLLVGCAAPAAEPQATPVATPVAVPESPAPAEEVQSSVKPGVYQGESTGFGGPMQVSVTVDESGITAIEVISHKETNGIGTNALDAMPAQMVETNSIAVDGVSGCTISSEALREAVKNAVSQSGLDMDALLAPPAASASDDKAVQDISTQTVVVGAGLSGLSAAIRAAQTGAEVVLLEKKSYAGGNSLLSTGVLMLGGTDVQAAAGIIDTPDDFYDYTMERSGGKRDPVQLRQIADMGNEVLNWLIEAGVSISDTPGTTVGSPVKRAHHTLPDAGGLIADLVEKATSLGIEIMYETPATQIITDEAGNVTGILATTASGTDLTVTAESVILATGGFGDNSEMIEKYWGMTDVLYSGAPGNTGEMIEASIALGADTTDIEVSRLTATVESTTNTQITANVLSNGGFLVTSDAARFCNETAGHTQTAAAELATGEPFVYEIFDASVGELTAKVATYLGRGIVTEANTIEELAEKTGLPVDALTATVESYNAIVRGEAADPFGREIFANECATAPFYCMTVRPGVSITPGGLKIDESYRVVKADGTSFANLFAVGEMTGGYRAFGYVGGDSLAHCVVSGYIAGAAAATK